MTRVWVSGSIAYDRIMDYPGRFGEHIDPTKTHILNISFAVPTLQKTFGGTAGNIAYGLRKLNVATAIVGSVGQDGVDYLKRLESTKVDTRHVQTSSTLPTAGAYVITDRDDNQVTGFVVGAMSQHAELPATKSFDWAIIASDDPGNMANLARHYIRRGTLYVFDPGQAMTALSVPQLRACLSSAKVIVSNDYEMSVISRRARIKFGPDQIIITTLGAQGSLVVAEGSTLRIKAARARKVVDPTGAGDAYRAGFLKGLLDGRTLLESARLASTIASFAVESLGTQTYSFTKKEFTTRYYDSYKEKPSSKI